MKKPRQALWIAIALGVGLIPVFVFGLWGFVIVTTRPIHPEGQVVPSMAGAAGVEGWSTEVMTGRRIVSEEVASQNLPGVSVAIGTGGRLIWQEGFGFADIERQIPAGPDTRFRIGTASQMLTSVVVGRLMEQGRLRLEEPVQTYVPEFPVKASPITLGQLMAHTAGIRRDEGDEENVFEACDRPIDALPRFESYDLRHPAGTKFQRSNYGWVLVTAAAESAAGQPFYTFARQQVFAPLGMRNTVGDAPGEPKLEITPYYFPRFAADPKYGPQETEDFDFSCLSGASAFISTAPDMATFLMALSAGRIVQPETLQTLQARQHVSTGEDTGYGLGWTHKTIDVHGQPTPVVGYDGELRDGFVSSLWTFPGRDLVIVVLANTSFADTPTITRRLAEQFVKRP